MTPLKINIDIKLHLINIIGIHIIIGKLTPVKTIATAPRMKVA